jgi:hypothetical protein
MPKPTFAITDERMPWEDPPVTSAALPAQEAGKAGEAGRAERDGTGTAEASARAGAGGFGFAGSGVAFPEWGRADGLPGPSPSERRLRRLVLAGGLGIAALAMVLIVVGSALGGKGRVPLARNLSGRGQVRATGSSKPVIAHARLGAAEADPVRERGRANTHAPSAKPEWQVRERAKKAIQERSARAARASPRQAGADATPRTGSVTAQPVPARSATPTVSASAPVEDGAPQGSAGARPARSTSAPRGPGAPSEFNFER